MPPSALSISTALRARLDAGAPNLPVDELDRPELARHPGRALDLVDGRGEVVARGIADPENGVLRVLSRDPDEVLDDRWLRSRLEAALALRRDLGLLSPGGVVDSAFRLVHGEGDGLGGFLVEVFGDFVIQYVYARGLREWGRRVAVALAETASSWNLRTSGGTPWPRGVLQKVRSKDAARPGKPVQSVVHGESPPEKYLVRENGVPFEIHPLAGLNVGLFTDMREHRWRLGRFAPGARVLNAFAYTGSLSVAVALRGAREVTSVDLSSGVLRWARENFRHAGIDAEAHRFEVSDVGKFLRRARDRAEVYDLVILDPPTYSAARAAAWSMKRDLPDLVSAALAVTAPGGILWLGVNRRQLSGTDLDRQITAGARAAGRDLVLLERGGLPPDSPTVFSYPESEYLKLRILRA